MESYAEFMWRVCSFEGPILSMEKKYFLPNGSVLQKVDENNHLRPFYGDTTVFELSARDQEKVSELINVLYQEVPECFAERLKTSTIHMTLHDLCNAKNQMDVQNAMEDNEKKLRELCSNQLIVPEEIRMRSNFVINMVNTSIVLALVPTDEKEYYRLMRLYNLVDNIQKLPYQLTPHITLAYYSHYGFCEKMVWNLLETVSRLNKSNMAITLNTKNLVYQRFESMNDYKTVFHFVLS